MPFWSGLFGRKSDREITPPPVTLSNLRLQVFSENYFGMKVLDRAACAVRPLAPGLLEAIVEEVGGGERTMRWEYLRAFGKTDEELFDLARKQGAEKAGEVASEVLDGIQVLIANGFYLSALMLDTFVEKDLSKGVFVAPISWHHWCSHIVGPMTVAPHVQMMRLLAQSIASQMKVTEAEYLGTDVYWIQGGGKKIERIEMDGDEPVLSRELARTLEA